MCKFFPMFNTNLTQFLKNLNAVHFSLKKFGPFRNMYYLCIVKRKEVQPTNKQTMEKKTYYCVTNTLTDRRAFACITDVVEASERPESRVTETATRTIYTDWLTREEIAEAFPKLHHNYFERLSSFAVEL